MNYTNWLIELISIILADNADMTIDEVSITEEEAMQHHAAGLTPSHVYTELWLRDAGNYYKI